MKIRKLLIPMLCGLLVAGCATTNPTDPTGVMQYGKKMTVVERKWGKPDDSLAYQDYRAKGYYSVGAVGGSWTPQGGSVSGFQVGETYTPTTIVWIYKDRQKALFFEKRGLFFDERRTLIMVWRLVGWETLPKPKEASTK
ncbi:MAG: hypothetical protein ACXWIU_04660 [Limisphaerales bacterium]